MKYVPKNINPIAIVAEAVLNTLITKCVDYLKDYLSKKLRWQELGGVKVIYEQEKSVKELIDRVIKIILDSTKGKPPIFTTIFK
jgi:hypothetical protein